MARTKPVASDGERRIGRPPKIEPNEKTMATIKGCAQIQCTLTETAAVLGVSFPTLDAFFERNPDFRAAYDIGLEGGKASLRRAQMAAANRGNATVLVHLGRVYLGQTEKQEVQLSGPDGNAIQTEGQLTVRFIRPGEGLVTVTPDVPPRLPPSE
jgi:hypothetical protein